MDRQTKDALRDVKSRIITVERVGTTEELKEIRERLLEFLGDLDQEIYRREER